jgi:sulfonate transport system ATP-binding protein
MTALVLKGLCKEYFLQQQWMSALVDVNLCVEQGSFVTIVGKSGCGKTTLLRIIAGLEPPSAGEVVVNPRDAKVGMVFQEPRLMPWLTVGQNMALAMKRQNPATIKQTVQGYLELLGLSKYQQAYPAQLSGGMAQRVALGRALCYHSDIILMDEPLSALDAFTRRHLQDELITIFQQSHKTIFFVTHDVDEALLLGQKVIVMDKGKIVREFGIPFSYPRNRSDESFYHLRENVLASIEDK